jgi:DNA transposition AAA+ family ATPase
MALSCTGRERLRDLDLPSTREVIDQTRAYAARADLTVLEFADRIGYARSSLNLFLQGKYDQVASNDLAIRAALCDFMQRNPLSPRVKASGRLFETENVRIMRRYFTAAVERGEIALIYGPPGTQKSFTLCHLIAERNLQKKNDAVYVYASDNMTPMALIKRIGREAGAVIGARERDRCIKNLLDALGRQGQTPALIIDEAQHLPVSALELIRELHDRSGCGVVLAGSHDLFEKFMKSRAQLEQWLSRIDHKEPLPGLLEEEAREIAARELGNGHPAKLSDKQIQAFISASRVDDVFARGTDGRLAPRKYLSVRRLVKVLAQVKAAKERVA